MQKYYLASILHDQDPMLIKTDVLYTHQFILKYFKLLVNFWCEWKKLQEIFTWQHSDISKSEAYWMCFRIAILEG